MPSDVAALVARNIRRFRQERQLSLGQLAARAGVSKQTLSTIEQGGGNPTIETLTAVAAGLRVALRRLLTEWGTPVYVKRGAHAAWQDGPFGRQCPLGEIYGSGFVRTYLVELDGPAPSSATDVIPGTLHHVFVVSGRVRLGPGEVEIELDRGDFARFPGDVSHRWESVDGPATVLVVSTVPQVSQFGQAPARA